MPKTRKYKRKRGGGIKSGLRIGGVDIFEWSKPSIVDGRTCYGIGPFKWCTRKKAQTP
jgi:hypothetical protein